MDRHTTETKTENKTRTKTKHVLLKYKFSQRQKYWIQKWADTSNKIRKAQSNGDVTWNAGTGSQAA